MRVIATTVAIVLALVAHTMVKVASAAPQPKLAEVHTQDGLSLRLDGRGTVASLQIDSKELLAPKESGGFFVADVKGCKSDEENMVPNSSFEKLESGKPMGWGVGNDWSVDHAVSRTGSVSMRVSIPDSQKRSSGALSVEVAVKPNTPYQISLWMRTDGGAPSFYIVQMDGDGHTRSDYPQTCLSHNRKHADWFQLEHSFTTAFFCRKLLLYTNLWQQSGTAWIDDVSLTCLEDDYMSPQQLVRGKVSRTQEGIAQVCELKKLALRFTAKFTATPLYIVIDGNVQDTSGTDRAVTISFRLPLAGQNWRWDNDIRNTQPVDSETMFGACRVFGQRRVISLLPFSAMTTNRAGLALAVPMDMPRAFRLGYMRRFGYFVNYEFGLSQETLKFPGKAWFRFYLYRVEPRWGLRSAAERYYRFFPHYFTKRVENDGPAGFMVDADKIKSPQFVPPAFAIFDYWKRDALPAHRDRGVKLFSYTEFSGWWGWAIGITKEKAATRPTPEEAWQHVEDLATGRVPDAKEDWIEVARSIRNCAPHDSRGKPLLHREYVAEWGGYNYLCNPDPEIEGLGGKVNRYMLTCKREVSQVDNFHLEGMYFDCVFVFATDNFRREHFRWADNPLAFDHESGRPVLPMAFSIYECAKTLADAMHAKGKLVMSNYSVTDHPTDIFCIQFIDIIGNEMLWTWTTDAKFSLQRTLAYQKPISMTWQEAKNDWDRARIEREMKEAMFYGIFYWMSGLPEELQRRFGVLIHQLATAGWEPVTYAWFQGDANLSLMVERFGSFDRGDVYFTLRNPSDKLKTAELVVEAKRLGLTSKDSPPRVFLMRDALSAEPLQIDTQAELWQVPVTLPAQDTVVVHLTREAR